MEASRATLAKNTYGYDGTGIKVGILDMDVPFLDAAPGNGLPSDCVYYIDPNGVKVAGNTHAVICGDIIANVVPQAVLYFAGGNGTLEGIEWLVDQGVDVISMSIVSGNGDYTNSYTDYSRWYDHIGYEHYITMCLCAGNSGDLTTPPTSGIGASTGIHEAQMAYNVITVGSLNFNSTPSNYADDIINDKSSYSSNSSFSAPFKPDICAPYGDTSQATALTAGIVALIIDARPSLTAYPEAIKAILAASVNPSSPYKYLPKDRTTSLTPPSYMRYGAGVIDAYTALQTALQYRYINYYMNTSGTYWTYDFTVTSTARVRIALAFLQPADDSSSSYTKLDMDLYILNTESGGYYASSTISANNVEIVTFDPPSAGTYTIRVHQYAASSSGTTAYFAVAWN